MISSMLPACSSGYLVTVNIEFEKDVALNPEQSLLLFVSSTEADFEGDYLDKDWFFDSDEASAPLQEDTHTYKLEGLVCCSMDPKIWVYVVIDENNDGIFNENEPMQVYKRNGRTITKDITITMPAPSFNTPTQDEP